MFNGGERWPLISTTEGIVGYSCGRKEIGSTYLLVCRSQSKKHTKDRTLKLSGKKKESLSWSREVFFNGSQKAETIRKKTDDVT